MSDDDLIRRREVLERLELAEHDAEERDWRSGANEIARLRKYVAALPARGVGVPTDPRPEHCRFRLRDEGKPYEKSSCSACGKSVLTGLGDTCHKAHTDAAQADEDTVAHVARLAQEIGEIGRDLGWHRIWQRSDAILAALAAMTKERDEATAGMFAWVEKAEKDAAALAAERERTAKLVEAGNGLNNIIEGVQGAMEHGTWRDEKGQRLKDTPEWVAFYNARAALTGSPR